MSSPILEALPSIHVTVIGVIAAFFSAFAIYAYQKVNESKEEFDSALKNGADIINPNTFTVGGQNRFLKSDGLLNWDGNGKEFLRNATSYFSYLDYEEKYGIPRSDFQTEPDPDEVVNACNELFLLLSTIFMTYPFWGNSMVHVVGQSEKVEEAKRKEFDSQRLQEMQRIVGYLCWTWNGNSRSIVTLARKGAEFERVKQLKEQQEMFKKQTVNIPESERQRIWNQFHQPHVNRTTDYESIFVEYFQKAQLIEREIIPVITNSLNKFNTYNEKFKVKETTLKVILVIAGNLTAGVIVPLITLNMLNGVEMNWSGFWFSSFEYFLLFSTMLPYLWACKYLYHKVKTLNFA